MSKAVFSKQLIFFNYREINKEIARLEQETTSCLKELQEVENLKNDCEVKKDDLVDQIANEKSTNFEREKEFNDLTKQTELEREKEVVLQSDRCHNVLSFFVHIPCFNFLCFIM